MPTQAYIPEIAGPVSLSPAAIDACPSLERRLESADLIPDSPDGLTFAQPCAPTLTDRSSPYAGLGSRVMTDAKGESRNPQFRQRFHGLRVRRPDPNGESGFNLTHPMAPSVS